MSHGKLSLMMSRFTLLLFLGIFLINPVHASILDVPVSVSVQNANVREVLAILSSQTEASIVTDPRVRGNVSINLTDVSLKTALHYILDINHLGFQMIDESVYVAPITLLNKNAHLETVLIPLRQLDHDSVKDVISRFLEGDESVDILARQNVAVLRVSSLKSQEIQTVISELIDMGPAQIDLQVYIMEVSDAISAPTFFNEAEKSGDGKILARPKMKMMDDKPAEIFIGDKIPYFESTTDKRGRTTDQVKYIDVGIKLRASADIDLKESVITLTLKPEVSFVTDYVGSGGEVPVIRIRSASTTVKALDGETVFIGGLISSEDEDIVSKVPFMGSIPLIGNLFKNTETKRIESELVIAVTPHIIRKSGRFQTQKQPVKQGYKTITN